MPERVILLAGEVEAPYLTTALRHYNPALVIEAVTDRGRLEGAFVNGASKTRLISFLSDVIVPDYLLAALDGPAYNFHPGPPEFPGSHAAGFAVYDDAASFGVTLHEMAPRVDSGAIVEVRRFDVAPGSKFIHLEQRAFELLAEMFHAHAAHFAADDAPLPLSGEVWTGVTRTKAEAERLMRIESGLSEEEINRRYRAFG